MTSDEAKAQTKRREGFSDSVYLCSAGYLTVGYGHALLRGSKMPRALLEALFEYDYAIARGGYYDLGLELDSVREAAVTDMIFNMGLAGVQRFKKMMTALRAGDYETAADEIVTSVYYNQVGKRAREIEHMIRTGTCLQTIIAASNVQINSSVPKLKP